MSEPRICAEFEFVTNRSFAASRIITVPSCFGHTLYEHGLVKTTPVTVTFRSTPSRSGSIRIGWRAGGKYFQVRIADDEVDDDVCALKMGTKLSVRVLKDRENWLVELS
jgi:hypothetical protein